MLFIYTYFPIAYICRPTDIIIVIIIIIIINFIIILISHCTSANSWYFQFLRNNFEFRIITMLLLVS